MRSRHRLEFDLFLKRRKARLATAAVLAAAAEEAAAAQQSQQPHRSPGQTQYYTLPNVHPGNPGSAHMVSPYGAASTSRTAFLPTAAAIGMHMQQQAAVAAAASRGYAGYPPGSVQNLGEALQQLPQNHQPGSSLGHGFTLPLNTSGFQQHLQNMKNLRGLDGQGSSLTPSPTVSPTPAPPPAVSPLPPGDYSTQHSTNPSSSGTITAAPSISGNSQLSAQSPEYSVSGSIKGGQGSTPDTPTRVPLMPHPQMGIPTHYDPSAYSAFAAPSPYATIRAPAFGQPLPPSVAQQLGGHYPNPAAAYASHAPGYYFPQGYIG